MAGSGSSGPWLPNPLLTDVDGLNNLTSVGGWLEIVGNPGLTDISGFSSLASVTLLSIGDNDALTQVTGFSSLNSAGTLYIQENELLDNLDAFSPITLVAGGAGVDISNNPSLTNIDGLLGNISPGGNPPIMVWIWSNPLLCQSSVDAVVASCMPCAAGNITGNLDGC